MFLFCFFVGPWIKFLILFTQIFWSFLAIRVFRKTVFLCVLRVSIFVVLPLCRSNNMSLKLFLLPLICMILYFFYTQSPFFRDLNVTGQFT